MWERMRVKTYYEVLTPLGTEGERAWGRKKRREEVSG
jgi:hypothetical protein